MALFTILSNFETTLRREIEQTVFQLAPSLDCENIDLTADDRNEQTRQTLSKLKTQFSTMCDQLNKMISEKITTVDNIIKQDEYNLRNVLSKNTKLTFRKPLVKPTPKVQKILTVPKIDKPEIRPIKVTPALTIPAIVVNTFDKINQDGNLYFITSANHFGFKLAGKMFHGNIGTIMTDEKCPNKVKSCKFKGNCTKGDKCDYYHNPLYFNGSKDIRCYTAGSWVYTRDPNRNGRKYGSLDNLDIDITNITPEDEEKFYDQTMHDILCAMLLKLYR